MFFPKKFEELFAIALSTCFVFRRWHSSIYNIISHNDILSGQRSKYSKYGEVGHLVITG